MSSSKPVLEGHEKPRKLEDDTAGYLGQMDLEFDKIPAEDVEGRSILVDNVIREVEHRLASASCDRRTNFIVEKFITDGSLEVLIDSMKKCKDYVVFLARNRFASHIVQSLLARLTYLLKDQPNAEEEYPSLVDTVVSFCSPLLHDMHWLSQEQCSSHVLRSMVCLLAGVPPVAEKKTKKAKHQHSVTYSLTLDELVQPGTFPIAHKFSITVPARFKDVLLNYCDTLYHKKSAHDLQLLVANVSSNAFLLLLLRVLACSERFADQQGSQLAQNFILKIMELSDPSEYEPESSIASSTFFGMAGDRAGSYFLEAVTSFLETNLFLGLVRGNCLTNLDSFLQDTTSNFVLQSIIRRLDHELQQVLLLQTPKSENDEDGERSSKKRKKESKNTSSSSSNDAKQYKRYLVQTTVDLFEELLQSVVNAEEVDVKKRSWQERGGVLLSLLQCSIALRSIELDDDSEDHKQYAERMVCLVLFTWTSANYSNAREVLAGNWEEKDFIAEAARFLSQRITAPVTAAAEAAAAEKERLKEAAAIAAAKPAGQRGPLGGEGRGCAPTAFSSAPKGFIDMSSQLLLCRMLGAMLTFPILKISLLAANIVTSLEVPALKIVSTTGNMSRSIFDTYLQFYSTHDENKKPSSSEEKPVVVLGGEVPSVAQQAQMTKQLSACLVNLAADLAGHFVGQHIVKRIFEGSDIRGKERWVQVLSAPAVTMNLQRTKEGRHSLLLVQAEAYQRDATEWRNMMKKQMKANDLFKDFFDKEISSGANAAPTTKSESKDSKKKESKKKAAVEVMDVVTPAVTEDGEAEGDEDEGEEGTGNVGGTEGKRKRKRKRAGQNKNKGTA